MWVLASYLQDSTTTSGLRMDSTKLGWWFSPGCHDEALELSGHGSFNQDLVIISWEAAFPPVKSSPPAPAPWACSCPEMDGRTGWMYEPMVSLHSSNTEPDASTFGSPRKEHAPLRATTKKPCGTFQPSMFHKVTEFLTGSDSRREQIALETESRMRNIHQDDIKSKDERSIHEAHASMILSSELRPFHSKGTCTPLELMLSAKCTPEPLPR